MSRCLYIEPISGIAGDMFVAAAFELLDNKEEFLAKLNRLPLPENVSVRVEKTIRNGIKANRFVVTVDGEEAHGEHHHGGAHGHGRTLEDIEKIISAATEFSEQCRERAKKVFRKLAAAEATVHGAEYDKVHFHEVGAVDAIVDVMAAVYAVESLGVRKVISAAPAVGNGVMLSAHGAIPIPAPATIELLKGVQARGTTVQQELTTPTGAALLRTFVDEWSNGFSGTILNAGYGAGSREIPGMVNALRMLLINTKTGGSDDWDKIGVVECSMDDFGGEAFTYIGERLLEAGALDFAIIPATMKKGRPGVIVSVICDPEHIPALARILLRETTTLGVRWRVEKRHILNRVIVDIDTPYGKVPLKVAFDGDGVVLKAKPEQRKIEELARERNLDYFIIEREVSSSARKWMEERDGKKIGK